MSRLQSRSGLRVLSILILVLALVGGGVLHADRQAQQRASVAAAQARLDAEYNRQLSAKQQAAANAAAPKLTAIAAAQLLAGRDAATAAAAASATAKAAEAAARKAGAGAANRSSNYGPVPTSCKTYTGNREIGCTLLVAAGFGLDQMPCLDKMWTRESNWRTTAENPSSHSYGIPQALPGDKMATIASDWKSNPVTQIKWGLGYIQNRYKTPCGAWDFWQDHNFY